MKTNLINNLNSDSTDVPSQQINPLTRVEYNSRIPNSYFVSFSARHFHVKKPPEGGTWYVTLKDGNTYTGVSLTEKWTSFLGGVKMTTIKGELYMDGEKIYLPKWRDDL